MRPSQGVDLLINPFPKEGVFIKGNMVNISTTIPINISKPNIMENVHIGANYFKEEIAIYTSLFKEFHDIFSWSYEEMLGIDPSIVEHEIRTYLDTKPVQQNIRLINPQKVTTVKVEVEKLLKTGFIYPISLMELVSNLVLVDNK